MKHYGDVTKISGYEVEIPDVLIGGSPCQDLSVAGKRKGIQHSELGDEETTRSGLFIEQIRIFRELRDADRNRRCDRRADEPVRPRYLVWENVPGALSSGDKTTGGDFRVVLEEMARCIEEGVVIPGPPKNKWETSGCILGRRWSIAWRVTDAQWWGVPQRRRRICVLLDADGHTAPEILFEEVEHLGDSCGADRLSSDRHTGVGRRQPVRSVSEGLRGDPAKSAEEGQEAPSDTGEGTQSGHPAITMQCREGCAGGGKGPLVAIDRSATLSTNNNQVLFDPARL